VFDENRKTKAAMFTSYRERCELVSVARIIPLELACAGGEKRHVLPTLDSRLNDGSQSFWEEQRAVCVP
jgi:hypothetical protein